jgi:hypothetical protein
MDRAQILACLQAAEEQVTEIERRIANRREFVLSLKCAGEDATGEIAELLQLEQAQMQHIAERDWLRTELAMLNAARAAKSTGTGRDFGAAAKEAAPS